MKHLFIVNPVAGKMKRDDKLRMIREAIVSLPAHLKSNADFEIYETKAPLDACKKIEAEAVECDELRVYACGGDGTLNECVTGVAEHPNASVTHFPCGTGNDFIKSFGDEKERFFDLAQLVGGEVRKIDLIRCNDRYSVNICSVGLDARIAADVHKYSSIPLIGGSTGYVTSAIINVFKGVSQHMKLLFGGGRKFDEKITLLCACNGSYYGGGFNPVPEARVDDGILDILAVKNVSVAKFLACISAYAKGQFRKMPDFITYIQDKAIHIDSEEDLNVNLDGEAMTAKHVDMQLLPGGLGFIFPVGMKYFEKCLSSIAANVRKTEISVG